MVTLVRTSLLLHAFSECFAVIPVVLNHYPLVSRGTFPVVCLPLIPQHTVLILAFCTSY